MAGSLSVSSSGMGKVEIRLGAEPELESKINQAEQQLRDLLADFLDSE